MGGVASTLSNAWSAANNQACLAMLETAQLGVSAVRHYNLGELTQGHISGALPIKKFGNLGFSFSHLAMTDVMSDDRFGLSLGRKFGPNFSAGIQLQLLWFNLPAYGNRVALSPGMGFLYLPNPLLSIGVYARNIFTLFGKQDNTGLLPPTAVMGISYVLSEKLTAYADAGFSVAQGANMMIGASYKPNKRLRLRAGVSTATFTYSLGLDIRFGSINVLVGISHHQRLGASPELGMNYGTAQ
ncbi:MAG: hypothetical protein HYZ16_07435 [Bacteroidetes bacterium]|nr:hypothetical protein [Bacteroidota bacterium]